MTALPPVRRRLVGAALRRYRQDLGYGLDDAAHILDCDRSKISRIETGQRGIRNRELRELLTEYGLEKPTQDVLAAIATPRRAGAWRRTCDGQLPDAWLDLMALEAAASKILIYEAQRVPELLQTQDYAAEAAGPALAAAIVARQEATLSDPGHEITVVTGEAALRQLTGDRVVMRDQLAALAEACTSLPHVSVQVLPFAREAHAVACSFAIFQFAAIPELGMVCLPGISGAEFLDGEHHVSAYETAFGKLRAAALDPDASARMITSMAEDLMSSPPDDVPDPADRRGGDNP
jgi:transcriptional regulator with XRE-family HTH domain